MAIGGIPPWVRGPDVLGALSSGASAGAAAGRMEQEERFESQRLGLEAMRLRQSAALSQAQLQQSAEQHAMEFQARQKLAEQNQLREQQRLNIENAYKTAALGIAQGRLEETKAAADQKAKQATLTFQREQAFARDVTSGVPVMEAYQRNPVSSALLRATQSTLGVDKPMHVGESIVERDPQTGEWKAKYTAPRSQKPIKIGKQLVQVNEDGTVNVLYGADTEPTTTADEVLLQNQSVPKPNLFQRIFGSSSPAPAPATKRNPIPKAGEIKNGHRFKGGDPTDEDNWETVGGE